MKKKLFLFMNATAMLFASCGQEKKFDKNLQEAYKELQLTFYASTLSCDQISKAWYDAIYDKKTPSGKYCSDFNDALQEQMELLRKAGINDTIFKHKSKMEDATSRLNNPPASRKDCYNEFVEIVGETSSFSRMATDPSGNLRSYSENKHSTFERISKMLEQFKIKYSQFLENN